MIMNDKTPMYILIIVGIVALVAVVHFFTSPHIANTVSTNDNNIGTGLGNAISGNVVADDSNAAPIDFTGVGRFLFGAVLIGISVYMYTRHE